MRNCFYGKPSDKDKFFELKFLKHKFSRNIILFLLIVNNNNIIIYNIYNIIFLEMFGNFKYTLIDGWTLSTNFRQLSIIYIVYNLSNVTFVNMTKTVRHINQFEPLFIKN